MIAGLLRQRREFGHHSGDINPLFLTGEIEWPLALAAKIEIVAFEYLGSAEIIGDNSGETLGLKCGCKYHKNIPLLKIKQFTESKLPY